MWVTKDTGIDVPKSTKVWIVHCNSTLDYIFTKLHKDSNKHCIASCSHNHAIRVLCLDTRLFDSASCGCIKPI